MNFTQAGGSYTNNGTISDGATISASGFRLTNSEFGRIYGLVTFDVGGSTLINEKGGVISLSAADDTSQTIIFGSPDSDTVINGGLIKGAISLGSGDDSYILRDGSARDVDLGLGNDTFRVENADPIFFGPINGGVGQDRVVMAGTANQYWGDNLTGFEQLVLETGGNFENFSGYQSILLTGGVAPATFFNLIKCLNPTVDVAVNGQALDLHGSSLHSVTGGENSDYVTVGFGNTIANGISLGGGDDQLTLDSFRDANGLPINFSANGGSGSDTLMLTWFAAGDRSFDLTSIQSFEKLNLDLWYVIDPSTVRLSHVSGFTDIDVGQNVTLVISDSDVAGARVGGGLGGGVTLSAGITIDRYGFSEAGFNDNRLDIVQGDPALSTTLINHGSISGDVRFYIGDDLYDGRDGSAGGTIYGNAGNDTMIGGSGREIMVGGYGADVLTGGAGHDIFKDTLAGHRGDTITDFSRDDVIIFTDASLASFSFSMSGNQLSFAGGSMTIANAGTAALAVSAAPGGGVQLFIAPPPVVYAATTVSSPATAAGSKVAAAAESATLPIDATDANFDSLDHSTPAGTGPWFNPAPIIGGELPAIDLFH